MMMMMIKPYYTTPVSLAHTAGEQFETVKYRC